MHSRMSRFRELFGATQRLLHKFVFLTVKLALQVYNLIDQSDGFYTNNVHADYRSHTALPFR